MNKNSNLSLKKIEVQYPTPKIMDINQEYIPNITFYFGYSITTHDLTLFVQLPNKTLQVSKPTSIVFLKIDERFVVSDMKLQKHFIPSVLNFRINCILDIVTHLIQVLRSDYLRVVRSLSFEIHFL